MRPVTKNKHSIPALFVEIMSNQNEIADEYAKSAVDMFKMSALRKRKRELMTAADQYVANQRGGSV